MMDWPKDGFDLIALRVVFSKIRKVRKRSNLGNLLLFGNCLKNGQITVSWE